MANLHDETLADLRAYNQGDKSKIAKIRTREYTAVMPLKKYTAEEIKKLREQNRFTQYYFGEILGVSLKTIQAWEAGTNKPTGTALRLFQVLEQDPHALDQYLFVKS